MSTIIKLRCIDQVLTFDSTPLIASGGVEEDRVEVDFCPKWDGLIKTATFWRNEKDAFHVLLDEDDSCAIPKEVLIDEGAIYLGFFGVSADGKQRTSQVLRYNVVKGAITTDAAPDAPTADIYTQLLAKYLEMVQIATDTKTDVEQSQEEFRQEILDMIEAGLLPDNSVATEKLKDGAVTKEKLAPDALAGSLPVVSMNAPTSADNVAAGYAIGKTWLRPNYTLNNLAYNKAAEDFTVTAGAMSKEGQTFTLAGNGDDKAISAELSHGSASGWLYAVITADATATAAQVTVGSEAVALTPGEAVTVQRRYTGESISFAATYETANAAAAGTVTVENLTIIDEAATLAQVDESCRDVSDNTVFGFVLTHLPFEAFDVGAVTWKQVNSGAWDDMLTNDFYPANLVVEKIQSSREWIAPRAAGQKFTIIAVGGGGGGMYSSNQTAPTGGGGSGYIEKTDIVIPAGEVVEIVCGAGGGTSTDGGATSFGSYVTAAGGKGAIDGKGADGEAGGGGGNGNNGGHGRVYGGGGGSGRGCIGGNGGTYGGGGGGGTGGIGGTYGGNGGNSKANGSAGAVFFDAAYTPYLPLETILTPSTSIGGTHSNNDGGGGGGLTGNGGNSGMAGGGGGGYSGNGGIGAKGSYANGGGGGGCYGGNGGNGATTNSSNGCTGGGGGGGFFCNGADGYTKYGGGGGGFFADGNGNNGGNGGVLIAYYKEG